MRVTISGTAGSGKSSVAKMLAEKLGYKYYSIGRFMREIADKRKIHLYELSKIAESDKSIDFELDERQKNLNNEDNFVMDSRLGFYFINNPYKVFLKADIKEAAKRIFNEKRKEEKYQSLEETEEFMEKRIGSEKIRYKKCYGIDFTDENNYDLIIDTTSLSKEEVVEEIVKNLKDIQKNIDNEQF